MILTFSSYGRFYIRTYKEKDEKKIISLFKEVFNQDKPEKLWEWEFLENPYGTEIVVCESEKDGIIAQCAGLPAPFAVNGKIYRCAQLVDCMCKKEYRTFVINKKPLFTITVEAFFDKFTGSPDKNIYLYGFPGERHYKLGKLILKYRKTKPALEATIHYVKSKKTILKLKDIKSKIQRYKKQIKTLAEEDADIFKVCLFKEPNYFFWRYVNSYKSYDIFALCSFFGKIKAICVILNQKDKVYLIDLLGVKFLKDVISHLFYNFKKLIVMGFSEGSITHNILKDMGATITKCSIPIIPVGRSFWHGLDWDFANSTFYFTMGDCDLF